MRSKSCIKNLICFFLVKGGMFGFLLVFLFQNFSAQIYVSGNALIHVDNNVDVYISDSDSQPSAKIYVSSGTVITNLEHHGKYEIIAIAKPQTNKPEKVLAQKEIQKIASTNTKIEEKKQDVPLENSFAFSTHSNSDVSFAKFSKTGFTLVSGGSASSKIIATFLKNNFYLNQISQKQSNTFLYSDCSISNHHLTSFSVRPPPFFT